MPELVMQPSWIMLRLRRPHDGNSQNHGLCSDFVGPMVFFGISTDDGSLLFSFQQTNLFDLQYQPSRHIPTQGIRMAPKHRQSNITDNAFPLPFSRIWPIK
jgi:hypothetical protein